MKQHIQKIDADIIGMVEIDAKSGERAECYHKLIQMMKDLGYSNRYYEKDNHLMG